jgi:plasmid stabilization system protein ParE
MRVRLLRSAELELFEAFEYYNALDDDGRIADRFLDEVEQAKRSIAERPRAWMEIEPGVRQKVLHRFPFALIYEIDADEIRVFAVAHHSRRPGYWRDRE